MFLFMIATITASASPATMSPAEIAMVKDAVRSELRDPESATFKMTSAAPKTGRVCGMVNAKNLHGGYVGYRPFFAVVDKTPAGKIKGIVAVRVMSESDAGFRMSIMMDECRNSGYVLG
jgi:hypothetical protein